jgi:primosomal protein N' (replication factor Y)
MALSCRKGIPAVVKKQLGRRLRNSMNSEIYADIVVKLPARRVDRLFTYLVPAALAPRVFTGSIVNVPFKSRTLPGFVIRLHGSRPDDGAFEIREISSIIEERAMWREELINLSLWMHDYYGCTLLDALQASLPPSLTVASHGISENKKHETVVSLSVSAEIAEERVKELVKKAPAQAETLSLLLSMPGHQCTLSVLNSENRNRHGTVTALLGKGLVDKTERQVERRPHSNRNPSASPPLELNAHQAKSMDMLSSLMAAEKGAVMLLHGITGSGKTEIYLQALEACLKKGKTGIVLIPEISLTPQTLDRFRGRFGNLVAVLHSGLSEGERADEWRRINRGETPVVLGARSAIFAPLRHIGLIVVDEEHESSYKQESEPRYHARQIAIRRALSHGATVVLGSATPSMESIYWAKEGKYSYCYLPERVMERKAPDFKVVDLRKRHNRRGEGALSPYLVKRIKATVTAGDQAVLLLNRRGFHNYLFCHECGHIIKCRHCDIALRVHRDPFALKCHYCHYEESAAPTLCPNCKGHSLSSKGAGTQSIENELSALFPDVKVLRMDSDTTSKKGAYENLYDSFCRREAQILLGTQMIAKGLDFPDVTLVGVILADVALSMPDFRASERTYQLLVQVAGRTCRGDKQGEVVIQTYSPDHPSIVFATREDSRGFYVLERQFRSELSYPPLLHMIRIVFSGPKEDEAGRAALRFTEELRAEMPKDSPVELLGPSPCPVPLVQNRYRHQLLIKCPRVPEVMKQISPLRTKHSGKDLQITVDADAVSFL